MTRAVSVLEVSDPAVWAELEAITPLSAHLEASLGPCRRVAMPSLEREVLPKLREAGARVLVRYARRTRSEVEAVRQDLRQTISKLPSNARRVLHAAQRHALDDVVLGAHAWDPLSDAAYVRHLYGAGLLRPIPGDDAPHAGRYHLHPDLPGPPDIVYDFEEAAMKRTDDLSAPGESPIRLLHDLAGLSAGLERVVTRRTHAGTIARTDARRLGRQLGAADLAEDGNFEGHPRWARALRALEALGAVSMDPITRELHIDHGLEPTLAGHTRDALDRFVHHLVDRDLHVVLPAIREALRQAGDGAVDQMIFLEQLVAQHRTVLFTPWHREGTWVYPTEDEQHLRVFDDEGFEQIEAPMVRMVLKRLTRLGLIVRAPGVFAATPAGRRWVDPSHRPPQPIWVSSDLELMVPPGTVNPWERHQLERLCRCLSRDVVDRYRLDREGLETWLATHDLDDALGLLRRHCPAIPDTVVDTLEAWSRSAMRVVLTRGVLLEAETA